jgi:hypothetical protein
MTVVNEDTTLDFMNLMNLMSYMSHTGELMGPGEGGL